MNLLELISRAKNLYMIATDPNSNWLVKIKALVSFVAFLEPILEQYTGGEGFGDEAPKDVGVALAELESCCAGAPQEGFGANGEIVKKLLAFLKTILPLLI